MSSRKFPLLGGRSASGLHVPLAPVTWETLNRDILRNIFCVLSADQCLDLVGEVCHRWRAVALSIARPCLFTPECQGNSPNMITFKMHVPVSFKAFHEDIKTAVITQYVGRSSSVNVFPRRYLIRNHCCRYRDTLGIPISKNSYLIGGNSEHPLFLNGRNVYIHNLTESSIFRWILLPEGFGYGEPNVVSLAALSTLNPSGPGKIMILLVSSSYLVALLGSGQFLVQPLGAGLIGKIRSVVFSDEGVTAFLMDSENTIYKVQINISGNGLDFVKVSTTYKHTPWLKTTNGVGLDFVQA